MAYALERNGKCLSGVSRCKWSSLGRTSASQASVAIDEKGRIFTWGQNSEGQCGQGNPHDIDYIDRIPYATQLGAKSNWIKACSGEISTIAMNSLGELWGWGKMEDDCEAFGLPPGSGTYGNYAYVPVRVTPGYVWKDFTHCYYYTMAIGNDDKLYVWGMNYDYAFGMDNTPVPEGDGSYIPIKHTLLTDDIKLIDCEAMSSVAVTVDDKVYVWGEWFYHWFGFPDLKTPREITGLVIPSGETIVDVSVSNIGVAVVLSNGELWAAGEGDIYGDNWVTGNKDTFIKIPFYVGKDIIKIRNTSLGSSGLFAIASDGNIWGFGGEEYSSGNSLPYVTNTNMLIINNIEGQRRFIDVINNEHNQAYQAIDEFGFLWTWGSQRWGPHLAIGAVYSQAQADSYPDIEDVVALRIYAGYADVALDYSGEKTTLNAIPVGESEYVQAQEQLRRHRPCGHWHLRLFEVVPEYAINCWMTSLKIKVNTVFFVAAGKHQQFAEETGCEIYFMTYNIGTNEWTTLYKQSDKNAANRPGGVAFDDDIYVFFNYKLDSHGDRLSEWYDNPAMGVWVIHGGSVNYTEWYDGLVTYGQNKVGAHQSGLVALAYTDTSSQVLVKVSTDFGVTFSTVKTIAPNVARKDFSLIVDVDGNIYIAHQVTTSSVMVEKSTNNGASWTTKIASNFIVSGLSKIKLSKDSSVLFLFCSSDTVSAIEYSKTDGVSWSGISSEPGSSIIADGTTVSDGQDNLNMVLVEGDPYWYSYYPSGEKYLVVGKLYNYLYDLSYGGYSWFERNVIHKDTEGRDITKSIWESDASLESWNGRYVYSSFNFYSAPDKKVAIAISENLGRSWAVISSPLTYTTENEITNFDGDPLFYIDDVKYLNHIWRFEKSDWNTKFVKQKDKYVHVIK